MEKHIYIRQEIDKQIQYWAGLALLMGCAFFLLLSLLDFIATPENFIRFLEVRVLGAVIFACIYFLNRSKLARLYQVVLIYLAVISSSIIIEYMILHFGGHSSTYYAGLFILVMVVVGFIPIGIRHSFFLSLIALCIYILPILLFDRTLQLSIFSMPLSFLVATFSIANVWRYLSQQRIENVLSLQYDLSQEKEQLKQYSTQLEEIVAQRTKELAISEQKYRGLFDNASDGVAVYDTSGIILNVNRMFCEQHGFPADTLIGSNLKVFDASKDHMEESERIKRIEEGESLIYEARHVRRDGETALYEISAKALNIEGQVYIQAFYRDISDKKRLQEQLFQSQKMDSIGMLAGGLAHDFNNIICAIIGHIELLGENDNLDSDARNRLSIIEASSRRASKMISKLLKFARKGAIDIQPVELNAVVRDTYDLISKTLSGKNAEVILELNETIPEIMGDANQIEQVIMNLMVNAGDAMPSGGRVTVKTDSGKFGREASLIHPLLAPGSYVILTVSDTGTGIADDIKSKIFDPFFTTKEHGKGTGLGLAMVYGIVKDHKGVITVESQSGKGTTFKVYLPASDVGLPSRTLICDFGETARGTVLVIDDHKEMLSFVTETVEALGYIVRSANSPIFALQLFKENIAEIELVITDIFMPLIDGRDVVKNIKSIKPSTKVIAMSGYQIEEFVRQDSPVDTFLRKPFGRIELIAAIRRLMQPSKSIHSSS